MHAKISGCILFPTTLDFLEAPPSSFGMVLAWFCTLNIFSFGLGQKKKCSWHKKATKEQGWTKLVRRYLVFLLYALILDVGLLTVAGVSYEASDQPAHSQAISYSPMPRWSVTERC
jgi:hypothetical protein